MTRPHLLLLHGALGVSAQYRGLLPILEASFDVSTLDFEGHGPVVLKDRPLRIAHFAENVLGYLDARDIPSTAIFGHSLGGIVGLYLARFFPARVSAVFTLGSKFNWTAQVAEKENAFLNPETLLRKAPGFAQELRQRHVAAGWERLLAAFREMHTHIGQHASLSDDDLSAISAKVRIGVGDRDRMTGIEESVRAYRLLQNGELQVFPATPHPLEMVAPKMLADAIMAFF